MTDPELPFASATAIAAAIRDRRLSSVEVVDACLRRIEAVNPRINAVVRLADGRPEAARQADADLAATARGTGRCTASRSRSRTRSTRPVIVTTAGTVGWAARVPDRDATVVARLKAAGGILLGQDEHARVHVGERRRQPRLRPHLEPVRPRSLARLARAAARRPSSPPAGRRSTSAATPATASGSRRTSVATAGLKPTSGRVPRTGHSPSYRGILESLTQLGPIARRVEDLALLLPIIAGPDGDRPARGARTARATRRGRRPLAPRRVVRRRRPPSPDARDHDDGPCRRGRAARCRAPPSRSGCHPTRVARPDLWDELVDADGHAWLRRLITTAGTPGRAPTRAAPWVGTDPRHSPATTSPRSSRRSTTSARPCCAGWPDVDLIVSPVLPHVALLHGDGWTDAFQDGYSEVHNLTGWPAGVVRGGTSPRDCRSASNSSPPRGARTSPWRPRASSRPPWAAGSPRHCEVADRIASRGDRFLLRSAWAAARHPPRLGHVHPHRLGRAAEPVADPLDQGHVRADGRRDRPLLLHLRGSCMRRGRSAGDSSPSIWAGARS